VLHLFESGQRILHRIERRLYIIFVGHDVLLVDRLCAARANDPCVRTERDMQIE
jgi:hypothetical protein